MKVKYKGESCELIQEISKTLLVVQYHGKPILAERKELVAPGDAAQGNDRSENKRRGGSRKTETKAKKKAGAKK